jgi:hypothetical protein
MTELWITGITGGLRGHDTQSPILIPLLAFGMGPSRPLPIYLAPIADLDDENAERAVVEKTNDPVIADAVFPELAGIVEPRNAAVQESQDAFRRLGVEFIEIARRSAVKLNPPGNEASSTSP